MTYYRCGACGEEVVRGWLPPFRTLYYPILMAALAVGVLYPIAWWVRQSLPPPPAEPPPPAPWWVEALMLGGVLLVILVVATLIGFGLSWAEDRIVRPKSCPKCGARRWSRVPIRGGFGL
ncbi:MAG: hypothetical protein C0501_08835 [Isosphaera sp.]|nr:hypothetical protein [Isosphaera sp.]